MKVDLSEKNNNKKHGNILFSANILKRWSLQKKLALEDDFSSCIIWTDYIYFYQKYDLII